ncbi:MAG: hypothetical protein A2287_02215 [Candidatus Melainabacteria bacterium RIFOXYA12_FULL_32_12]|nr:MAG: hypothetical protein A2255_10240 [Candidatus Melainabacteria bacterium RIFOXYA2_FULL_32_9]OGI30499.1 MAG: hypothetical protein A2287_02215 [Candidatus Melainabacteria bacterium RIFOXYA12_FULL_32_12]
MTDLNGINPNSHIRGKKIEKKIHEENKVAKEQESVIVPPKTNFKEADEILNFLNNSSLPLDNVQKKQKKTIQVSKHVNPEQAQRISNSVNNCIKALLSFEEAAIKEFGLSQSTAQALAVQAFEEQYMPS